MDNAFLVDWASWADVVFETGVKVIGTEVRRDVDAASAVFGGDV